MTSKYFNGVRQFDTGATRSSDDGKPDYAGYLSALVLPRYGEYMLKHQYQADGTKRASDNWQNGLPLDSYISSMFRHFLDVWSCHKGVGSSTGEDIEEELCALLFNVMGYLHEHLKAKRKESSDVNFQELIDSLNQFNTVNFTFNDVGSITATGAYGAAGGEVLRDYDSRINGPEAKL